MTDTVTRAEMDLPAPGDGAPAHDAARADAAPADGAAPIAAMIGEFAAGLRFEDLPAEVVERAKLFVLDCVGIAFASTTFDFAHRSLSAVSSLGGGDFPVIGFPQRLALRDAMVMNGILVHGLDYDDTHVPAVCHASTSAFPLALGACAARHLSGRDLVLGYVLGVEVAARIGMAANGGFHAVGFHPTGLVGAFGCATAAAKLSGLPALGIAAAQGFVGSMAGGLLEFLEDGAWTKRAHPGLAAAAGATAAAFAKSGFEAPARVYEGRFGLFATHLAGRQPDLGACTAGLGEVWEVMSNAVKPYPACHFTHAFADAVLEIARSSGIGPADVKSVRCLIHPTAAAVVCEPAENKLVPRSDYDAKFSLPFVVAASLVRDRFTLAELRAEALSDPAILEMAARVTSEPDPASGFPKHYSGEVIVTTRDGRELRHREQVNRGADDRPLSAEEISDKFLANMALATDASFAERVLEAVLGVDRSEDVRGLAELLRG